jgi:hypothetical protein
MKPRYIYPNLLAGAAVALTPSSEDAAYPKANLFCERQGKPFQFTGHADENVVIDLGSAQSITAIAILNHNFTANATITLQANSASSWSSPPLSQVIPWAEGAIGAFCNASYRYWRLRIQDSNNAWRLRTGELVLGVYGQLPFYLYQSPFTDDDLVMQHSTDYGQSWVYQLAAQRSWQLGLSGVTDTVRAAIIALKRALGGPAHPFVFWTDGASDGPYFVRMKETLQTKGTFFNSNELQLELTEDPIGIGFGVSL